MLTGLSGICGGAKAAATAMAFKLIKSAQRRWRMVNAPHPVALVCAGATFVNGNIVERPGDPSPEASSPPAALEEEVAKAAQKILIHRS